jgi:hypothetical protein
LFSARLGRLMAGKVVYAMSRLAAAPAAKRKAVPVPPAGLSSSLSFSPSSTSTSQSTAAADNGDTDGAITVGANARYGIPCVY